ncbi:hypothetical protein HanRHA438_Chr02g0093821 [Helianthus annuus]|nr:hypothetical protein HanRHA438_Chr02g0093821 [Helianthus annuus]
MTYTLAIRSISSIVGGTPSLPCSVLSNSSSLTPWRKAPHARSFVTPGIAKLSLLNLMIKFSTVSLSRRRMWRSSFLSFVCLRCWLNCKINFDSKSSKLSISPVGRLSHQTRAAPTSVCTNILHHKGMDQQATSPALLNKFR